ncbi:MAG TPA: DinB family protein [Acidobacteriaceae bacterium]|jgi:uncharacterized damage-inducible protein DinB|nr:DinB family protein [Acidobacteriaceae bacterium]
MTLREFYLERRRAEGPAFVKVLRALPADQMDYKPHHRSPSAEQIAWTMTSELRSCIEVARNHQTEWRSDPAPPMAEMIALFEQRSNELTQLVEAMDEEAWNRTAQFYVNGKMVSEQPASTFLWFIHFDAIHHRAQLTTYLRPMGGKVPSIYGPSADERPS